MRALLDLTSNASKRTMRVRLECDCRDPTPLQKQPALVCCCRCSCPPGKMSSTCSSMADLWAAPLSEGRYMRAANMHGKAKSEPFAHGNVTSSFADVCAGVPSWLS